MTTSNNFFKLADVAKALSLTPRRVQQLVKESILPRPSIRGQYDLPACIVAYEQYDDKKPSSEDKKNSNLATEKLRLLKAKPDKAEFEFAVSQGEYITLEEVKYLWSGVLLTFRSKMLAMSSKLAGRIFASISNVAAVEEILQNEVDEALTELAKHDYGEEQRHYEQSEAISGGKSTLVSRDCHVAYGSSQ